MKTRLAAVAAAALAAAAAPAAAKTFSWSFQSDARGLDPYILNETFTLAFLGNVYEGLVRRGPDLEIRPALATRWERPEPTRWRFHLRRGVRFHDGGAFAADDVVFSARRARAEGSDLKPRIPPGTRVIAVDDHTVDFVTPAPNPILISEWATWYIMDREWCEANGAAAPSSATAGGGNHANRHANGTGPFRIESREPGVRTVLVPNPDWWDAPRHNLSRAVFTPVAEDGARVDALLSGRVDLAYPVPAGDVARVDANPGTSVLSGPELRVIFLGMDQARAELPRSGAKGRNPFRDRRVREAVHRAIDADEIRRTVMRGRADPAALLISPKLFPAAAGFERPAFDPARARALLAAAGYPGGFRVTLDCPDDRYVNDERICAAVARMLGRVGVRVDVLAQAKAGYFAKILRRDTSFYLLGWTPSSFESWNVLHNLLGCPDPSGRGRFNLGGYCSPELDRLAARALAEPDPGRRGALFRRAFEISVRDVAYVPLHLQRLAWGKRDGVSVVQPADNSLLLRRVTKR